MNRNRPGTPWKPKPVPRCDPDRALGSLLGLAVCEALAGSSQTVFPDAPLPCGLFGDGTSMALALAESLTEMAAVDQRDQMIRYASWFRYGHLSATETCAFIDESVRQAIVRFEKTWDPEDHGSEGDVCLARMAPVAIFFYGSPEKALEACAQTTRTTHAGPHSLEACALLTAMIFMSLGGHGKADILRHARHDPGLAQVPPPALDEPDTRFSLAAMSALRMAVESFCAADSFAKGALSCRQYGRRAMAAYGQLAGAWYGAAAIPRPWRESLVKADLLQRMLQGLLEN